MARSLVVCIGNDLVADDAAGPEVYRQLQLQALPGTVRLELLGLGGMALLEELRGEELLVVVDAVQLGAEPGTVHVLEWERIPANELRPVSGHGIGVREALQVCRRLYPEKAAASIYLVGIEGACFDGVGDDLTPAVKEAIPTAVAAVLELVGRGPEATAF